MTPNPTFCAKAAPHTAHPPNQRAASAGFEWWRLRSKSVNKSYLGLFGFMMRRSESSEPHSTLYYLVGVTFTLLAYSTEIAVCSILFLAFCDPAATLFGRNLGHLGPRLSASKSLVGFFSIYSSPAPF
jgi:dolichol kinase